MYQGSELGKLKTNGINAGKTDMKVKKCKSSKGIGFMRKILFACILMLTGCSGCKNEIKRPESYNYQRGCEAMENQDVDEAMTYLQKELEDDPQNGYAWAWMQCAHLEKEEYGDAITAGTAALKYLPRKNTYYVAFVHATFGRTYHDMNETGKAIGEMSKAIKLMPDDTDYLLERGDWYCELKEYEKSNADFEKIIKLVPGATDGYMGLGRNLMLQERYDEAKEQFTYATKLDEDYSAPYAFRASCFLGLGESHEAAKDIVKALEMDGNNRAFIIMQDVNDTCFQELVVMMKTKVATKKSAGEWNYYLGLLHEANQSYEEAIRCYEQSMKEQSEYYLFDDISDCYYMMGNYPMAKKYIELAIKVDSADTDLLRRYADIYYYSGQKAKAINVMGKYVDANPESSFAYYRRGFYKDNAHDIDGAIEDYSFAIVLNPDYAYSYLGRGDMYMLKGDSAKARSDYEKVVQLDTIIGKSGNCRQYALLALGMRDSAEKYMKRILEEKPEEGNYYDAACLMNRMGKQNEALEYLRTAFQKGYHRFAHLELDDDLDGLRETEEYKALIKEWKTTIDMRNKGRAKISAPVGGATATYETETTEIPFKKDGNIMMIDCTINNLPLHFIFDTGASDVSLSQVEANFMMKNGYLTKNDVQGKARYSVADGGVHEGTVLNLRHVNFGGLELRNVKASVVKSQKAPLLLGQSVLERLGRIEIDNDGRVVKVTHMKR